MIWGVWLLEYAWIFFSILTINNYKGFNPRGTFRESCPPPLKPDLVYSQYTAVSEHSCGQGLRLHCPSRPWHACTLDPAAPPLGFFIWSFDCWSSSCTFGEGFLPGGASQIVQWKEFAWQCRRGKTHRFNPWAGKIPWRQKWLATPVFLPGTFHGQRSLAGYSPWGHQDLDTAWACTLKEEKGETLRTLAALSFSQLEPYPFAFFQTQGPQNCWSLLFRAPETTPISTPNYADLFWTCWLSSGSKFRRRNTIEGVQQFSPHTTAVIKGLTLSYWFVSLTNYSNTF